jgi:mono/diheme cytochrome c family protein
MATRDRLRLRPLARSFAFPLARAFAFALALWFALPSVAWADDAHDIVTNNCLGCHAETLLSQQRLTPKQWAAVVKKMIGWGAQVEPEHVEALVSFLAARYAAGGPAFVPPRISAKEAEAAWAPQPDGAYRNGDPEKGKTLYVAACQACHGADARGTPTGMVLADRPMLYRAAEFAGVLKSGIGRMPSFASLSKAEVAGLLAFLRTQ